MRLPSQGWDCPSTDSLFFSHCPCEIPGFPRGVLGHQLMRLPGEWIESGQQVHGVTYFWLDSL